MTKPINETTEQRTIDYILHWGEQHELFQEALHENRRRNPDRYPASACPICGEYTIKELCDECLANLPY